MSSLCRGADASGSLLVFWHRWRYFLDGAAKGVNNLYESFINRGASDFYSDLAAGGFAPNSLIDVLPGSPPHLCLRAEMRFDDDQDDVEPASGTLLGLIGTAA
jgi:hypothetical protein